MNESYSEYLNSREWLIKRSKRLAMSRYSCEACGSNKAVEVHHLTYERVFKENMEDLLPLCYIHHRTAEDLVKKGEVSRHGDVHKLREDTLRLIQPQRVISNGRKGARNRGQEDLMQEEWFFHALKLGNKQFKAVVRAKFENHPFKSWMIGNAFALRKRGFRVKMKNPSIKVVPRPRTIKVKTPEVLYESRQINGIWSNNRFQDWLLSQQWLMDILHLPHKEFKRLMKQNTVGVKYRNKVRINAFTLHDRAQNLRPTNPITLIGEFSADEQVSSLAP